MDQILLIDVFMVAVNHQLQAVLPYISGVKLLNDVDQVLGGKVLHQSEFGP